MKSMPKLIRRFVGILLLSFLLLLVLNFTLLIVFTLRQTPNARPWKMAEDVAGALTQTDSGAYVLPEDLRLALKNDGAWAILIDDSTRQVVWQTEDLPETVPLSYTLSDIAALTRGYIDGYPTFPGERESGLVVLGYPKDSFWKHIWPSWDYYTIANLPKTLLWVLVINVTLILLIYVTANSRLLKSVRPIVDGIQRLPTGETVHLRETGVLSEIAANINRTFEILRAQKYQLQKKESARANWIAGVSHDIRTPLSMVMGYAGQLKEDTKLPDEARQKAAVIVKQSERMKNLISDLNLASKLEYNMQPLHRARENMIAILRQAAVDFMNLDIDGKYPIVWETEKTLTACPVMVDKELIKRAFSNLIQNSMRHNPQGCRIFIRATEENGICSVEISDDGVGASDKQLEKLNRAPHSMGYHENAAHQRHGLGLLLVKQILAAHGGETAIGRSPNGGFSVTLRLPSNITSSTQTFPPGSP